MPREAGPGSGDRRVGETEVEINDRHDQFPLTAEAVEAGRPADHHQATLRLLLNGLIATVEIPATAG